MKMLSMLFTLVNLVVQLIGAAIMLVVGLASMALAAVCLAAVVIPFVVVLAIVL